MSQYTIKMCILKNTKYLLVSNSVVNVVRDEGRLFHIQGNFPGERSRVGMKRRFSEYGMEVAEHKESSRV